MSVFSGGVVRRLGLLLVLAAGAGACSSAVTDPDKAKDLATTQSIRAAVAPCMILPNLVKHDFGNTALGGAVVGAVITQGLNLIGNALEEAGKENVAKTVVSANVDGLGSLRDTKCLQIVRGRFDQVVASAATPAWVSMVGMRADQYDTLKRNGLGTNQQPEFVFEAYFRSPGGKYFALSPTLVAFFHPVEQRLLSFGRERDILVEIAVHEPDKKFDDASNSSTRIHIGKMNARTSYFFQTPSTAAATPGESPWFSVPETTPFTVTAAVFETEEENKTLKFLAAIFTGSKSALEGAIKQAVLKKERDAARLAELQAQAELLKSYNTAFGTAVTDLNRCKQSGTVGDTTIARNSVIAANVAAAAASRSYPFSVPPSVSVNEDTNRGTCTNVLLTASAGH